MRKFTQKLIQIILNIVKKGIKGACEMLNDYLIEMDKKCDKNDFKACVLAGLAISINDFKKWKNYNKWERIFI